LRRTFLLSCTSLREEQGQPSLLTGA
jgi:hypothetical protein